MTTLISARRRFPLLPFLIGGVLLAIDTVTRIALTLLTGVDSVPVRLWPGIFAMGFWFDLVVICVLLAPVLVYEALLPNRWRASRWHRVLRLVWQKFIPYVLDKARKVRKMIDDRGLNVNIEIDGGVGPANIAEVAQAGVDTFVAGSAVFGAAKDSDPQRYNSIISAMRAELAKV